MTSAAEKKLAELGYTIPDAPAPAANYVPYVISGNLVFVSGQISMNADGLILGKLGDTMEVPAAQKAAAACALNLIAQLRAAIGDLDKLVRVVKLTGFVNSTPDFTDHPEVVNGASDLIGEVFGDKGAHARAAVGVAALPRGVAVEVEGIFEIA